MSAEPGGSAAGEQRFDVAIVGAGPSGIAAAVKLKRAGITRFVVLERAPRVGGAWRDNTYPGCAVDVPSSVYCFSFNPNPDWSRNIASQPEVLAYLEQTLDAFQVRGSVRLGAELLNATWSEVRRRWVLSTTQGPFSARHVIFATGLFSEPHLPEIAGLETFPGSAFHSARWDHGVELAGKRVAVIGTGCSAAQIAPAIQPIVEQLHVFQRTPAWFLPRLDFPIPRAIRWLFRKIPATQRALRKSVELAASVFGWFMQKEGRARLLTPLGRFMLWSQVRSPRLRALLTPRFTFGCKRVIFSNTFLPAMGKENVELIPHALERIEGSKLISAGGEARQVDVIVFSSGFELRGHPLADRVVGRDDRRLSEIWRVANEAYLGTTVPGVPNAYILLGPNLSNYRELISISELQLDYVIDALRTAAAQRIDVLEVRPEVCLAHNRRLQDALASTVYNSGCTSLYLDERGRNFVNWPWSLAELQARLSKFDLESYHARPRSLEPPVLGASAPAPRT